MAKKQENALRLLIIDDKVEDAEAIVSGLRNAGIAVRPVRAANAEELDAAVSGAADLVLAALSSKALPFADALQRVAASGKSTRLKGQTKATFTVPKSLAGLRVRVQVTGKSGGYNNRSANSARTSKITKA